MMARRQMAIAVTSVTVLLMAGGLLLRQLFPDARGSVDGLSLLPMLLALAAVGGLIAARRPDNSYGWVLLSVAIAWTVNGVTIDYAALALAREFPGAGPASMVAVATGALAWGTFVTFVLLLYPTGTLPSARWRWVGRAAGLGLLLMTVGLCWSALKLGPAETVELFGSGEEVRESGAAQVLNAIGHLLVFASLIAGVVALIVRRRRADAIQRLQLKWFAFGAALVAVSILIVPLVSELAWMEIVAISIMPVVIGIAILRWRLYDIDRIVSRTLAYALLTVLLVGIYLSAVTTLTTITTSRTTDSPVAVAAATLLAAAAFQPARRRIQTAVDHRFNRARYDAQRTVERFATSLRHEVDLDDVHRHLVGTVGEVLQPSAVSVWLRPGTVSR